MRLLRPRGWIRNLLLAVALTAINLGAGLTSWRWHTGWASPAPRSARLGSGHFVHDEKSGLGFDYWFGPPPANQYISEWSWLRVELVEVRRDRPPPGRLQVLSPILTSASITLLVILFPNLRKRLQDPRKPPEAGGVNRAGEPRRPLFTVCLAVAVAISLVALNLAAWHLHSPPQSSLIKLASLKKPLSPDEFTFEDLFGGLLPKNIILRVDGQAWTSRRRDGYDQFPRVVPRRYDSTIEQVTIDFGIDDSIVAYGGRVDQKLTEPRVIRPSLRSRADRWWPRIAALVITLAVLVDLVRAAARATGKKDAPPLDAHAA